MTVDPRPRTPGGHHRLLRRRTGTVVAGVGGGLADHLGVDAFRVRFVLTVLSPLGGIGILVYAGLWIACPLEPRGTAVRVLATRERWQAVGMVVLGVGLAVLFSGGGAAVGWIVGPLGVVLVGAAVVWREADGGDERGVAGRAVRSVSTRTLVSGRAGVLRALVGVLLVGAGVVAFLLGSLDLGQLQFGLLAALATLVGVVLLTVPWWVRLVRELGAERRARIRVEERDEIAAHLHDSVLQTLALIQKQSGDDAAGREVRRLARRQERELRSWLHGRSAADDDALVTTAEHATVAGALGAAAAEVEDDHGVKVAPVLVGDAVLDADGAALVAAAREAMVNAAKHSGEQEISVYVEVEPDTVAVFVRDRGVGFDPDAVAPDRRGLAGSVHARMERHGGRVRLRTTPGEGTEVGLVMPRRTAVDRVDTTGAAAGRVPTGEETT